MYHQYNINSSTIIIQNQQFLQYQCQQIFSFLTIILNIIQPHIKFMQQCILILELIINNITQFNPNQIIYSKSLQSTFFYFKQNFIYYSIIQVISYHINQSYQLIFLIHTQQQINLHLQPFQFYSSAMPQKYLSNNQTQDLVQSQIIPLQQIFTEKQCCSLSYQWLNTKISNLMGQLIFLHSFSYQFISIQIKTQQLKQNITIKIKIYFNLIIPQLRFSHSIYLHDMIHKESVFTFTHQKTLIYCQQNHTFSNVKFDFQIFPSLLNGLKFTGFIHQIQARLPIQILIKQNLTLCGCTKQFLVECQQISGFDQENSVQRLQRNSKDMFLKNNAFIQFCEKINNLDEEKLNDSITSVIQLQNSDYKVRLFKIIKYIQNILQQNQTKYLYQIQISNIFTQIATSSQQKQITLEQKQIITKSTNNIFSKLFTLNQTKNSNQLNNNLKYKYTANKTVNDKPWSQNDDLIVIDDLLIKENQKIEDKDIQKISIQKSYQNITKQNIPHKIGLWRALTIILSILLIVAMVSNIVFLNQRQVFYRHNNQMAISFSTFIADISSAILAMREHNYYSYVYSIKRPQISFLINKLAKQQTIISNKIAILAPQLKTVWRSFQILPTGRVSQVNDTSYVVISNYMLSSITYISQRPISQAVYPILVALQAISGKFPTPVYLSYLQGVYNGLYVTLPNLFDIRNQFLQRMQDEFMSTQKMYFIFSSVGGLLCLLVFILLSTLMEHKSDTIRSQSAGVLSSNILEKWIRNQKTKNLQKLKFILENNKKSQTINDHLQTNIKCLQYFTKTLRNIQQDTKQKSQYKSELDQQSLPSFIRNQSNDKTNRQFMSGQNLVQVDIQNNNPIQSKIQAKKQKFIGNSNQQQINIYSITYRQRLFSISFYVFVCLPSLTYFISIIAGGLYLNEDIIRSMRITSQVYNRKSYQQLGFLLTRQTALFESFLIELVPNWNGYMMNFIEETYQKDRKLQKMIQQSNGFDNLNKMLAKFNHNNLCDQMNEYKKSEYFNINFTKIQCQNLANGIMKQGFKQAIVSYLQTSIELFKKYPKPQKMSLNQRLLFLQRKQIKNMKVILAYAEQIMDQISQGAEKDLENKFLCYRQFSIVFSIISILCLVVLLVAIKYRWRRILSQRKQIQSIISLISLDTICGLKNELDVQNKVQQDNKLRNKFNKIDWKFYK